MTPWLLAYAVVALAVFWVTIRKRTDHPGGRYPVACVVLSLAWPFLLEAALFHDPNRGRW